MLSSLEIRNYRNLRHLTIEKLGRVNLLVGKNNTGKTSVLEAIYLWANYGNIKAIKECLDVRHGLFESTSNDQLQHIKSALASLYTDRLPNKNWNGKINVSGWVNNQNNELTLRFDSIQAENSIGIVQPPMLSLGISHTEYEKDTRLLIHQFLEAINLFDWPKNIRNYFIRTIEIQTVNTGTLYDDIATTDVEEDVVNAIQLIDPSIIKINFRTDSVSSDRYPIVRQRDQQQPVPLHSMGDGINRILTIILAMVNCKNGYLLIDEFENGLHYSVQEKLWEIIFDIAERLNIQVFATTHSNDTIQSFTSVLARQSKSDEDGKVVRLQLHNDNIRAVDYSPEELETAKEFNIEVR